MISTTQAEALTAATLATIASSELRMACPTDNAAAIQEAAAVCVGPLLKATLIAIELAGLRKQHDGAAFHDIASDYLGDWKGLPLPLGRVMAA